MIDVTMWGKALNEMPKLSQNEWQALDPVAKWLVACRASVLFMTFMHLVREGQGPTKLGVC